MIGSDMVMLRFMNYRVGVYEKGGYSIFMKISIDKPTDSLCATLNVATITTLGSVCL